MDEAYQAYLLGDGDAGLSILTDLLDDFALFANDAAAVAVISEHLEQDLTEKQCHDWLFDKPSRPHLQQQLTETELHDILFHRQV